MEFTPTGPTAVNRVTAPVAPPDVVDTNFAGRLDFANGLPTLDTVERLYDLVDFQRGCQVFLRHIMAAAVWGFVRGMSRDLGIEANELAVLHLDANGLLLTGNSETIYGIAILDTKQGPIVLDVPPRVLGLLNDQWMRPLGDLGLAGPDHGAGGRYLVVPPGFDGELPTEGIVAVLRPRTYRNWLVLRAFMGPGGDAQVGIDNLRGTAIIPLSAMAEPPATPITDISGKAVDTIHPTDIRYFEDLAEIIDYEPVDAVDPEVGAQLAQIGIVKGTPFTPDPRMRAILGEAAQVASFMAFSTSNAPREPWKRYDDRQWQVTLADYPTFRDEHGRPNIDHMVRMAWFGTGRTLAMGSEH